MKGIGAKKAKKKAKAEGKSKGGHNATKRNNRSHLHSENRSWNAYRKLRTKGKRMQPSLPGTPRGKHISKGECNCGRCYNEKRNIS